MPSRPLLIVAAFAVCAPIGAQTTVTGIAGLVSAGFSQEFTGARTGTIDRQGGLAIGLGLSHPVTRRVAIAPELLLVAKGGGDPASEAALRFRYLELPVSIRYQLPGPGRLRPFVAAGPVLGYLVSCTLEDPGGRAESCDDAYGPGESYAAVDVGLTAMLGLQFRRLTVSLRYEHGLRDVDEAAQFTARNRTWLALISIAP